MFASDSTFSTLCALQIVANECMNEQRHSTSWLPTSWFIATNGPTLPAQVTRVHLYRQQKQYYKLRTLAIAKISRAYVDPTKYLLDLFIDCGIVQWNAAALRKIVSYWSNKKFYRLVKKCVLNEQEKFGVKMFLRYLGMAIFALGHYILPYRVYSSLHCEAKIAP